MSPDSPVEARATRHTRVLQAAFLLMAGQVVLWWSGWGGSDLHRIPAVAGVLLLLAVLWRTRRDVSLPSLGALGVRAGGWPFLVLSALYFGAWLVHMGVRYTRFEFANFDLGIYSNVAFNTAQGRPFYSSILAHSHLGEHFSPITGLFAPLYALHPSVYWLFGAQALSFAAVPLVLWKVSRGLVPDPSRAFAYALGLSLLWGIYPPIVAAMRFPFHPTSLAAPWVLLAFYLVQRRQWGLALPVLLFLLSLKESLSLVWVGLGLMLVCGGGRPLPSDQGRPGRARGAGALLMLAGVLAALLMLKGVIPHFRDGAWGQAGRVDPGADLGLKLRYVVFLLIPLCGLPLLSWRHGIVALPSILLNLSTGYAPQYSSRFQYDDVIAPLLFAASLSALDQVWCRAARWRTSRRVMVALLALYLAAVWQVDRAPLRVLWERPATAVHARLARQLTRLAADYPGTWMYVQSHLGPHLHRYEMRQFPIHARDCGREGYRKDTLLVLSTNVPRWGFTDLEQCIAEIEARSRFRRLPEYDPLRVYYVEQGR